jgi:hypothetical protein
MGQFDNMGLKPVGRIGLSDRDRGRGNVAEGYAESERKVIKKDKPKTAAAGSPPPNKPPKKPTEPKGNDNNPKKNGYLDKGKK